MKTLHRQQGVTLFMAMIMLIILTMLALSSFNVSQTNMQIVSNMQQRDAALFAARSVMEEVISGTRFMNSPSRTLPAQPNCSSDTENKRCLDINGDGAHDVTVTITAPPSCVKVRNVKNSTLNLATEQLNCAVGAGQTPGVVGSSSGNSLCSDSIWEVQARAMDDATEASATVTQGVAVMTDTDTIKTYCP
ncbi:hypothetical protein KY495_19435 [Massilia sp. PAMC28688]|uniref:pilus assembly PilX family protein n=1 Tax=Massilia sp. PAMC28688 TaxID=2861283 RepID=UPI001C62E424|nr:PilX N-terminal domain-containing pilus assembly protein [Massilia sp. PAMC28688]QYF92865.1 hypothetical protein KY495_19435 [Massilia sp. PAMC28688]